MLPNRSFFTHDNLSVLRGLDSATVDLCYVDPPFNKRKNFTAHKGSQAEGTSFSDVFNADTTAPDWWTLLATDYPVIATYLRAIALVGDGSHKHYLCYMAVRLIEMHRVLKPTGSLYYHCDSTMSHYIKILLDAIFGTEQFRNEIIWGYKWGGTSKQDFARKHDALLRYAKGKKWTFNAPREPYTTTDPRWHNHPKGKVLRDLWDDIATLNTQSKERIGYPTQKPLALLKRVIAASSNEGDWVMDPFCGSGTTCVAAELLNRQWIGMEVHPRAYALTAERLSTILPPEQSLHHYMVPPMR